MIEFWIAAGAMLAAALALALPAFLRPRRPPADDSRRENIAAARGHLRELQNRAMPKEESEEYEAEIKTRLWEDAGESVSEKSDDANRTEKRRFAAADKTGAALACAILLSAPVLYWHLGAPSALSPPPNLEIAILGLRRHIAENPGDAEALALMGRTLATIGRAEEAAEYFARAREAESAAEESAREQN
ncbi:MAG: c-type cytochrome biogenesis protein CcmI [Gammaproteobacteria bacterium]